MGVYITVILVDMGKEDTAPLCEWRKERGIGGGGVLISFGDLQRDHPQHLFSPSYGVFCGRTALNEASLYISVQASEPMLMHPRRHAPSTLFTHGAHTRTKASCVCGSTEGAHISLYQRAGGNRVISGGNSRLHLRGQTIAASDQSGGDA